jgi:hypothetical protein
MLFYRKKVILSDQMAVFVQILFLQYKLLVLAASLLGGNVG